MPSCLIQIQRLMGMTLPDVNRISYSPTFAVGELYYQYGLDKVLGWNHVSHFNLGPAIFPCSIHTHTITDKPLYIQLFTHKSIHQ